MLGCALQPEGCDVKPALVFASILSLLAPEAVQFKVQGSAVHLDVVVTGPNQLFVPRLTRDDFEVFEDGVTQEVSFFSSDDVAPLTLVLLLDASSSIEPAEKGIKKAASNLVSEMSPLDEASVVVFSDSVKSSTHFTRFADPLLEAIDSLHPEGWTALYDAVLHSLDKLSRIEGRKALLVFTDGADSRPAFGGSKASKDEALDGAMHSEATIYTVGFVAEAREVNRDFLERLARTSGGRAFFPVNVDHLERSFSAIQEELHTQYRIGYTPKNDARDGAWRRIEVRIKGQTNLVVRTRQGYYAVPGRTGGTPHGS